MTDKTDIPDFGTIPLFPEIKIANSDWRDGIVVRTPNWLGDAVMAIPALMQLRRIIPENCGFFLITPPALADLFNSLAFIDKTVPLHKAHAPWSSDDIHNVKKLNAGIALLQNNSLRDTLYCRIAGIPKLFGAAKRGRSLLLTESFKFPKIKDRKLNKLHHAGRYLSMAYALGAPQWNGELPEFILTKEPELMTPELKDLLNSQKLLVVAPGAAYGEAKRWPSENFRKLCRMWIEDGGNVAAIGTAAEAAVTKEVLQDLPEDKIADFAGKTDLQDIIAILKHAHRTVANDSGIMHLSAILGGYGAAIFGSTDPTSTSPVSKRWKILFERQPCAPCFKRECPEGHYKCLKKITPEQVYAVIS